MFPVLGAAPGSIARVSSPESSARIARSLWTAALLVALVFLAYGRTLWNGFAFDDYPYLVDNPFVRAPQRLLDAFLDARTHTAAGNVLTYRPLRTLLFTAEFQLFGEQPRLYHAVNLALHAGVVLIVWRLALRVVVGGAAVAIAAVVACHPLQSEVVASIKAQDDLVAALAVTSALLLFDRFSKASPTSHARWLVLIPFVVGMLAKEHVLALPALLIAWAWIFHDRRRIDFALVGTMGLLALAFLVLRSRALPATTGADPLEGRWLFPGAVAAIPVYARLFVWPHPLSIDYPWIEWLPLGSWKLWLSIAGQVAAGVWAWRSRRRVVRLGVAWFYVLLLPSLNPMGSVVVFAERFAYLPLVGLALVVAGAVQGRFERLSLQRLATACGLLLLALTSLSFVRCGDWRDTEHLFRAALEVDPTSVMARSALRHELIARGRGSEALALLPQATDVRPPATYGERAELADRGLLAAQQGRFADALSFYAPIVAAPFAQWDDWLNYGTSLANTSDAPGARRAFERALALRPGAPAVLRMLSRLDMEAEDWPTALERLREAVSREPDHVAGWYFLVYVTWRVEGDRGALDRIAEANTRNIALGPLIKSDWPRWETTKGALRAELRRVAGMNRE
jgi:Flp pilus assembly protein TadD